MQTALPEEFSLIPIVHKEEAVEEAVRQALLKRPAMEDSSAEAPSIKKGIFLIQTFVNLHYLHYLNILWLSLKLL